MRSFQVRVILPVFAATFFSGCSNGDRVDQLNSASNAATQSTKLTSENMDPYLQQLFARPDDFRLCNQIFVRISRQCDASDEESLAKLTPGQRVVLHVWGSFGLIGNGGLSYLLSADIEDIAGIASSYELIDVPRASKAFRAALALFPDSKPPKDNEERVKHLESLGKVAEERLEELSKEMWASDRLIKRNLATFVRSHAADFAGLSPSPWEDLNEFEEIDLPPPPADANATRAIQWLESIGAVVQQWDDAWADVRATTPAPQGNPIVSIRFSEHRNSTDQELRNASTLTVLRGVRAIDLEGTYVTSAGLNCLSQFPELRRLSLADTDVGDGDLERLHGLKGLIALRLNQTAITTRGIDAITGIPSLEQLELERTSIDDQGVAGLASLHKLKSLSLRWTRINGSGLNALSALPLETLELMGADVSDEGLSPLRQLPRLKSVELRDTAAGDATLSHLAHATSLESLSLESSRVTDDGLVHLSGMRKLQYLSLDVTSVRGHGFKHFSNLTNLKDLHLYRTACDDAAVEHLSQLQSLESLWMSNTLVTDDCCEALAKLRNITKLDLEDTRIEGGQKLRQLETLSKLEWISLSNSLSRNPNVKYLQSKLKDTEFSF